MFRRKQSFIIFTVVFLFLLSMVPSAAACNYGDWTTQFNGVRVPVNYITKTADQYVYRVEVPFKDGQADRKIVFYYRINLRMGNVTLIPAPPPTAPNPPAVSVPPVIPEPPTVPVPPVVPDPPTVPVPPVVPDPPTVPVPPVVPDPPTVPVPPVVPDPPTVPVPPVVPDPPTVPVPPTVPGQTILSADELQMFNLVNAERKNMGLNELKIHEGLVKIARLKSKDMIDRGYFAHQSPTYGSPFDMMKNAGIAFTYAGENLAGASTVARAHTSLMNSPGHRANILNVNYTHVGIGVVDGGPYGKMFTQMFITPK